MEDRGSRRIKVLRRREMRDERRVLWHGAFTEQCKFQGVFDSKGRGVLITQKLRIH